MNHDACAAQVRTIMRAAGLMPDKMTLMAELFASEEEDAEGEDDEVYEDEDIDVDPIDILNNAHLDNGDVEYEDDDEEDDEEVQGGDEGDDEDDDNSEVESFTLEEESSLDPKFLLPVDASDHPHASGRLYKNDIELHFSNIPESLTASATNVAVDHFTDSQLYHELQFASSDVHHVLDEVGATIAKMRISDSNQMPYLVHKLQEEVLQASTNRATLSSVTSNFVGSMSSSEAVVCHSLKPSSNCRLSPFNLQHVTEKLADGLNTSEDLQEEEDGVIHESTTLEDEEEEVDVVEVEKTVQFSLEELQRKDSDKLLLYAAASGHHDMVKLLLSTQKINIDKRGVKEMTPLMEAASGGYIEIVRTLLDHDADVNCKTQQGNSALMYSCAMGHLEIVQELISHGASIEDQNENGHTALMEAASAGHVEVARFLVSQGCNINVHSNEYKETALTLAAYKGHYEMVRFLINAGAGQEHRAEEMHTALMEASMDGHVEVARLLIDSGAQVNMPPDSFESPLTLAACGGHVELALLLLERGANIEEVNDEGYTALMEAAREGHEEMVALLISHGAQVNATTEESKETALFMACGAGCVEVVNLLIKAGADIELGTSTPLMEASQEGHLEIVKRLLEANANVNAKNSAGETSITVAAENGHTAVVSLLIAAGAEVDHCVEGGRSALMKAAQMGHAETVQLLINAKADVNRVTSNNEQTALSMACSGGHAQVVEVLLNAGADLFHRLKDNSTMLIEAAKGGHTTVVQMLIDYHCYKANGLAQQVFAEHTPVPIGSVLNSGEPAANTTASATVAATSATVAAAPSAAAAAIPTLASSQTQQLPAPQLVYQQQALQSKSTIPLPPSAKLHKKASSTSSVTTSCHQALASHIKLVNNTTFKIYPRQSGKRTLGNEPENLKFVRSSLVRIPKSKISTSLTDGKQTSYTMTTNKYTTVKSTRSLSDSFIQKSPSSESLNSEDSSENSGDDSEMYASVVDTLFPDASAMFAAQALASQLALDPTSVPHLSSAFSLVPTSSSSAGVDLNPHITGDKLFTFDGPNGEKTSIGLEDLARLFPPQDPTEFFKKMKYSHHDLALPPFVSALSSHPGFISPSQTKSSDKLATADGKSNGDTDAIEVMNTVLSHPYGPADNLASLPDKLASLAIEDNCQTDPNVGLDVPTARADSSSSSPAQAKGPLASASAAPLATTTTSIPVTAAAIPASQCSNALNCVTTSHPAVSYSNEFNFNFSTKLSPKEPETSSTSAALGDNPTLVTTASSTTTTTTATSTTTTTNPKTTDLFKRLKSFKSAPPPSKPVMSLPPMAATVSINTNTTSTATTAVCVGTLMPQMNSQTETTTFTQSSPQASQPTPSASIAASAPNAAPKITSFTATTKSITKVKNAVAPHSKGASADSGTFAATNAACQAHGQTRSVIAAQSGSTATQSTTCTKSKSASPSIDLNSQTDSNHDTALTLACAGGHEDLVKLLLARGADIEHREKKGLSPLMLAATNGHAKIVDILFSHGADLEAQTERTKDTALSLACSSGRYEVVENLLSRGANKEHRNVSDYTPLSLAASGGYVTIINLLLSYGAEINSRTGSKLGISPLMLAAMNGHTETTRLLLDRGSDINAYIETNRNTALTLACFQGRTEVVGLLVDRNANIEHRAKTGLTPLMEAASGGYVDVGRVLLDKGADVNAPPVPASRDTALTIAADKGHASFVELLINRGAMVDVKNKKGYSPLWLACNGGHFEVATILVNAKCDVDSQDNRKISCLMAAFRRGHVKIVKFLVKHVTQFPSDQEIDRCLALCADEELNKKAALCAEILHQAKERQAAEAYKNAANLLEEIDQERTREESRKAAAARRRERRKQKKKAEKSDNGDDNAADMLDENELKNDTKLANDDESREDEAPTKSKKKKKKKKSKKNAAAAANAAAALVEDDDDDEDTTAQTIDEDDFESLEDEEEEMEYNGHLLQVDLIADLVNRVDLSNNKKGKKKTKKSKEPELKSAGDKQMTAATSSQSAPTLESAPEMPPSEPADKKNAKKGSKTNSKTTTAVTVVNEKSKTSKDVEAAAKPKSATSEQQQLAPSLPTKSKSIEYNDVLESALRTTSDSKTIMADLSDLDSLHDDYSWNEISTHTSSRRNKNSSASSKKGDVASLGSPNQIGGSLGKREEGWKEVVRKSKKVLVPANAISRVIGRGGCNINTIREVSGAHIEVEKQKGQGDRMVIIRGSADATRHAHQLITVLSKETEKELSEIIRELGLDMLTSTVPTVALASTTSASSVVSSDAETGATAVAGAPSSAAISSENGEFFQSTTIGSSARASKLPKGSAIGVAKSVSTNMANLTTTSNTAKSQLGTAASVDGSGWTNSYGKASQTASTSSSTSNTVSYTMAINSKTRNATTATATTGSNSKSVNGGKILSAVYKPSKQPATHASTIFSSNRSHHSSNSTSSKSTDSNYSDIYVKGSTSPNASAKSSSEQQQQHQSSTTVVFNEPQQAVSEMNVISSNEQSTGEYTPFNSLYSSLWSKPSQDKANFASANNAATSSTTLGSFSSNQKPQPVEISVDESKAPGFNRQFVSPGSFSASSTSSFSSASALPLNISTSTSTPMPPQHMLGPIGTVRSAPCTPPISTGNTTSGSQFSRPSSKFVPPNQPTLPQPPLVDLYSTMGLDSLPAKSQMIDNFIANVSSDLLKPTEPFSVSLQQQQSSPQSSIFPPMNSEEKFSSGSNQSLFGSQLNRPMNFLDLNSGPSSLYNTTESLSSKVQSNRPSSLNPNAPDFPSRSNSFSTNALPHQSIMSHANSTNSLNGSNSSISSTGFNNGGSTAIRPGYPGMPVNAPPISNTAVRAAIVNYSMNLFQNQVPKQHQEAAARLAHLSAQNSTFVSNEFQNVFIGSGAGSNGPNPHGTSSSANSSVNTNGAMHSVGSREQQAPDKVRYMQYMYPGGGPYKGGAGPSSSMSSSTNTSTYSQSQQNSFNSNFGPQTGQFGAVGGRNPLSSSISTVTFSSANFANSTDSLNLSTVSSNLYASSASNSAATNSELNDDCLQRSKQPAPIGTERAQRKNPMHSFGPPQQNTSLSNHGIGTMSSNSTSINSNSLFSDQPFSWNIGNSADAISAPADSIFPSANNTGLASFNSDYNDLFLGNTGAALSNLSELNQLESSYSMLNQRQAPVQQSSSYSLQQQQQQKFNSISLMDGLPFDSTSQMSANSFKGLNSAGNSLFSSASPFVGGSTSNIDSDYWSSSSSSSIAKQTPNCSTSGINSAFDSGKSWNNWNS